MPRHDGNKDKARTAGKRARRRALRKFRARTGNPLGYPVRAKAVDE